MMKFLTLALALATRAAALGAAPTFTEAERAHIDELDAQGKLDVVGRVYRFMNPIHDNDPKEILRRLDRLGPAPEDHIGIPYKPTLAVPAVAARLRGAHDVVVANALATPKRVEYVDATPEGAEHISKFLAAASGTAAPDVDGLWAHLVRLVAPPHHQDKGLPDLVRALREERGAPPGEDVHALVKAEYLAAHAAGLPREALADHVLGLGSKIVHHATGRHLDFGYYRLPADDDGAFHRFHDAKPTPRPTPKPAPKAAPKPTPKAAPEPRPTPAPKPAPKPATLEPAPVPTPAPTTRQPTDGTNVPSAGPTRAPSKPGATLPPTPTPTSVPLPAPSSLPAPAPTGLPLPTPSALPLPAPTSLPLSEAECLHKYLPAPTSVPLPAPTSVPTCVEIIAGPEDLEATIDEDDCKAWKVTGLIKSLIVTSNSTAAEVEDVDVTFSGAGGVSWFLAVGKGSNAKATTIAAEGDIGGQVRVGDTGGKAVNTAITADSVADRVYVGFFGTAIDTNIVVNGSVGSILNVGVNSGTATNTNIEVADSVTGILRVGGEIGEATNTSIAAGSMSSVGVGDTGGRATNTNIAADSMDEVRVGNQGMAINTHICAGSVGDDVTVGKQDGTAIDTNIVTDSVSSVRVGQNGEATNTNIGAGSVGNVYVGYEGGEATATKVDVAGSVDNDITVGKDSGTAIDTNIAVADDVTGSLNVGRDGGTATDTNIAVNGSVSILNVGRSGTAVDTNIAVADDVTGSLNVGRFGGKATSTNIAVNGSMSNVVVGGEGGESTNTNITASSVSNVEVGVYGGTATDTNIAVADDVTGSLLNVGAYDGTAIDTNITASSVSNVEVGAYSGEATNTNIAADSVGDVYVGNQGTAIDTTITIEAGGGTVNVYSGATNTNVFCNAPCNVTIEVDASVTHPEETKCNGVALAISSGLSCSCPGTC